MTRLGELDLTHAAKEAAGNWQRFNCFVWFRDNELKKPEDWAVIYTHNRDSGLLDQSNAAVIRKAMMPFTDGDDPDVVFESRSHWAVGHVDGFSMRVFKRGRITKAFRTYHELADGRRLDHALMVGPPGLGKSAICQTIYAELAADYFEVLGQSIKHPPDLNSVLLAATSGSIVFTDECHELKPEFQTALYLALDKRKIVLSGGSKSGGSPQSIPLADFSLLLASTDEHCLLQPLRDRMRLLLRFTYYSVEELTTILSQRARALGWDIHEELLPLIARRSRGTPVWHFAFFKRVAESLEVKATTPSPPLTLIGLVSWTNSMSWDWGRPSSNTLHHWPKGTVA